MDSEDDDDECPPLVSIATKVELQKKTIPVTILTGFLGAGKTTLLLHIIKHNEGRRIAVIENEFSLGQGIEGMIVKSGLNGSLSSPMDNFFELNNGCICCSVKDSLISTLEQLATHRESFEYILIETTGVANPGNFISMFWMDDAIDSSLKLDGVVTVVDAVNIERHLSSDSTSGDATSQIAYADRILINKSDLVSSDSLEKIQSTIQCINITAEVKCTVYSQIDSSWVLFTDSFAPDRFLSLQQTILESSICSPCSSADIGKIHSANEMSSFGFQIKGSIKLKKLNIYLDALLYDSGGNQHRSTTNKLAQKVTCIYRMKGILHVEDSEYLYILQSVHDIFDVQTSCIRVGCSEDGTEGLSRIVIIGINLNAKELESGLNECTH